VAPVTAYSWDDLVLLIHMTWDIRINVDSFLPARSGMRRSASRTVWISVCRAAGLQKDAGLEHPREIHFRAGDSGGGRWHAPLCHGSG
jgi:hypothetical protein